MARYLDMGDITEQLKMKERLKCKDFSWFMKNVAYDVLDKYPELPPNVYWGEVSKFNFQMWQILHFFIIQHEDYFSNTCLIYCSFGIELPLTVWTQWVMALRA